MSLRCFALAAVLLGACADDGSSMMVADAAPTIDAAPAKPTVAFTVAPGSIAAGGSVTLTITATNFTLDAASASMPNVEGVGHYHIYLDDATGGDYLTFGGSVTKMVEIPAGTTPGAHTLRVELEHNEHDPFDPTIDATQPLTVL